MSVRRLQKIKGGSYIISLPSDWVRKMGLDVKSGLKVYEVFDGLKIRPPNEAKNEKVIPLVDVEDVKYLVLTYYMQGIDRIVVRSPRVIPLEVKKELRELQLQAYGLEVESETFDSITFKVNVNVNADLESSFRAFTGKILSIMEDVQVMLERFSEEMRDDLLARLSILNKDYRLVIRQIALGVQKDDELTFMVYPKDVVLFAIAIRDLGRFLSHLSLFLKVIGAQEAKEMTQHFTVLKKLLHDSVQMFLTEDLSAMREIRSNFKKLERESPGTEAGKEVVKMGSYCVAMMDNAVNKSVRIFDFKVR
ncbi:MAG: phosphate uptake regulator PhoU [Metallosphaera yellowstonensis]|jgi:phosphate uptake regulator